MLLLLLFFIIYVFILLWNVKRDKSRTCGCESDRLVLHFFFFFYFHRYTYFPRTHYNILNFIYHAQQSKRMEKRKTEPDRQKKEHTVMFYTHCVVYKNQTYISHQIGTELQKLLKYFMSTWYLQYVCVLLASWWF